MELLFKLTYISAGISLWRLLRSLSTIVADSEERNCVVIPDTVSSTLELELGALHSIMQNVCENFRLKT